MANGRNGPLPDLFPQNANNVMNVVGTHEKKEERRRSDSNRCIKVLQTSPLATWVRRHQRSKLIITKKMEGNRRGKTGSPGSEQPFFPRVRARALTVTPTGEPVNFTICLSKKVNKTL